MATKRAAYLPIAFIVVSILILGTAVAIVSFRDIGRGRAQVAEILGRQAGGIMAVLGADLRAELVAPAWQRSTARAVLPERHRARERRVHRHPRQRGP